MITGNNKNLLVKLTLFYFILFDHFQSFKIKAMLEAVIPDFCKGGLGKQWSLELARILALIGTFYI